MALGDKLPVVMESEFKAQMAGKVSNLGAITQEQFDNLNYSHTMFGSAGPWITGQPHEGDYGIILMGAYSADTTRPNGMQEITYTNGDRYYRKAVNGAISRWYKVATDADLLNKANWLGGIMQGGSVKEWAVKAGSSRVIAAESTATDTPYPGYWLLSTEVAADGGWIKLTATNVLTLDQQYCIRNVGVWSEWRAVATATELAGKANVTEETIAELSSPTQLMHGGRFNIQSISAEINAHASANASLTDYATGDFHALLLATHFDAQGCRFGTLLLTTPRSPGRTWVGQIWEHEFRNWILLATATKPEEHTLPLAEGKVGAAYNAFRKEQNGHVTLFVSLRRADGADLTGYEGAFALPEGYRPYREEMRRIDLAGADGNPAGHAHLHIYPDGNAGIAGIGTGARTAFCECGFWTV